jgi:hypothetical protein
MQHFFIGFADELQKLAQTYEPPPLKAGESRVTIKSKAPTGKKDPATGLRPGEGRITSRPVTREEKQQWRPTPVK